MGTAVMDLEALALQAPGWHLQVATQLRTDVDDLHARLTDLERSLASRDRSAPIPREAERRAAAAPAAEPATILLVEDAERVRGVVREMLWAEGYNVLEAWCGVDALEVSDRHRGPIHLVLTDVMMPHMTGRELADRLASLRPGTKVVYMSGYTDPAILPAGVLEPGTVFLEKPFSAELLSRRIRELIGASGAAPTS